MTLFRHSLPLIILCGLLAGCVGKAPATNTLRIETAPDCLKMRPAAAPAPEKCVAVSVREITALPGLDRANVLFARGKVLSGSDLLFWEGRPTELLDLSLQAAVLCHTDCLPGWTQGPRSRSRVFLAGTLHGFEVREDAGGDSVFHVGVHFTLWNNADKSALGSRLFTTSAAVTTLDPDAVARAANQALRELTGEVLSWVVAASAAE